MRFLIFTALLLSLGLKAYGETHNLSQRFGAGIILGAPSGLTGKYWMNPKRALDVGFSFYWGDLVLIYGDYLFHFPKAFKSKEPFVDQLSPYVGIGAGFLFWTAAGRANNRFLDAPGSFGLGVRVPLGIEWLPVDPPLGVFVEVAPGIGIIPGTYGFLMGGLGVRYYF